MILHSNGTMVFAYKDIGMDLTQVKNMTSYPINVGMSDGFIMQYKYQSRRKIRFYHKYIYSYHKVQLSLRNVTKDSAFVLNPLPNCIIYKSCDACLNANLTAFKCKWCPTLQRCSDSFDWHRQSWLENKCHHYGLAKMDKDKCLLPMTNEGGGGQYVDLSKQQPEPQKGGKKGGNPVTTSHVVGGIIAVIIILLVVGLIAFIYYAYSHPQSKAGMWLIEHRPRKVLRSFRRVPDYDDVNLVST